MSGSCPFWDVIILAYDCRTQHSDSSLLRSSDVTAREHLSLRSPVTTQKYSPSHITTGEEQAQRGSGAVFPSGSESPRPKANRWRLCHLADNRARLCISCTPTPRMVPSDRLTTCKRHT